MFEGVFSLCHFFVPQPSSQCVCVGKDFHLKYSNLLNFALKALKDFNIFSVLSPGTAYNIALSSLFQKITFQSTEVLVQHLYFTFLHRSLLIRATYTMQLALLCKMGTNVFWGGPSRNQTSNPPKPTHVYFRLHYAQLLLILCQFMPTARVCVCVCATTRLISTGGQV